MKKTASPCRLNSYCCWVNVQESTLFVVCWLQVVLCGGSAKIPRLQTMIQDIFPDVDILTSTPPDEVIAVGAALQASLLVSRDGPELEQESTTVEVSASDIMVKVQSQSVLHSAFKKYWV